MDGELLRERNSPSDERVGALYESLMPRLVAYCTFILGDNREAEDVAQQAFLRAWAEAEWDRGDKDVTSFIFAVARNRCFDIRRRGVRLADATHVLEAGTEDGGGPSYGQDDYRALDECRNNLPEGLREVIAARYFADRTLKEIAEDLGIVPAAVHKRIKKAEKELEECLAVKGVLSVLTTKKLGGRVRGLLKDYGEDTRASYSRESVRGEGHPSLHELRRMAEADETAGDAVAHVRECGTCLRLMRNMKAAMSDRTEVSSVRRLAQYMQEIAAQLVSEVEGTGGQDQAVVGYYAESDDDGRIASGFCAEMLAMLELLADERVPLKKRTAVLCELRDAAESALAARRKRVRRR